MKKAVFKLEVKEDKVKSKAMKKIIGLAGVDSVSMDAEMKLTVIGDIDPVSMLSTLRKLCHTDIVSVGPAKEPEQKDDKGKKVDDDEKKLEEVPKTYPHRGVYVEEIPNANACVIF